MMIHKNYVQVLIFLFFLTDFSRAIYGKEPSLLTGTFSDTLTFNNDLSMKFTARVPMKLPREKILGLILVFHPHGGNESSMINWPTKTFLERQKVLDQYVIIGLKSSGPQAYKEYLGDWEVADHEPSYKVFQWAMKNYPIDPRRVHIMGWSRGGFMVTRFIWDNLKDFASVTAYAGAYSSDWTKKSLGGYPKQDWVKLKWKDGVVNGEWTGKRFDYDMSFLDKSFRNHLLKYGIQNKIIISDYFPEFYHVHGSSDYVIDVNLSRCYTDELASKGISYIYRELKGVNHAGVFQGEPINMLVNDDVFSRIHATRNKIIPLNKVELGRLHFMKANISEMDLVKAQKYIKEAARIGGPLAGEALIKAFDSKNEKVRIAALTSAYSTIYGAAFIEKLGEIITDKDSVWSKDFRFNACHVLGRYVKWRQFNAKEILINSVLDRSLSQYIRFQLITALSKTYEMMIIGNMYDDREVVETLIKLLDDPDQGVRGYAHMILVKGTDGKGRFGYNAAANSSQRQGAIKLWQDWAKKVTVSLLSKDSVKK